MENKIVCVDCGLTSKETGDYSNDEKAKKDNAYDRETGEWLCMMCYTKLVPYGMDVGDAKTLTANSKLIKSQRG
jgi:hypothetical protein